MTKISLFWFVFFILLIGKKTQAQSNDKERASRDINKIINDFVVNYLIPKEDFDKNNNDYDVNHSPNEIFSTTTTETSSTLRSFFELPVKNNNNAVEPSVTANKIETTNFSTTEYSDDIRITSLETPKGELQNDTSTNLALSTTTSLDKESDFLTTFNEQQSQEDLTTNIQETIHVNTYDPFVNTSSSVQGNESNSTSNTGEQTTVLEDLKNNTDNEKTTLSITNEIVFDKNYQTTTIYSSPEQAETSEAQEINTSTSVQEETKEETENLTTESENKKFTSSIENILNTDSTTSTVSDFETTTIINSNEDDFRLEVSFEPNLPVLTVNHRQKFELNCSAKSSKVLVLHSIVYKDKELLVVSNDSNAVFTVKNARMSDQGKYTCISFLSDKSRLNYTIIEVVVKEIDIALKIQPSDGLVKITEGDSFQFKCTAHGSQPYYQANLYKNNRLVSVANDSVSYNIQKAVKSDQGRYMCHGFTENNSNAKYEILDLLVDTKNEVFGFENEKFILSCSLKNHYSRVEWKKIDSKLSKTAYVENGYLNFEFLKFEDQGLYECSVNDEISETIKLIVKPTKEPLTQVKTLLAESTILLAKVGETIQQICTVITNGPNVTINWYNQTNQKMKPSDRISMRNFMALQSPFTYVSVLSFKDLQESDYGAFECRQMIFQQIESTKFDIKPDNRLPIFFGSLNAQGDFINQELLTVHQGQPLEISCFAKSDDNIKMILFKDDIMIETSRKNNINFKIQNTQKSNQGVYTCKAYTLNSPSLSFKTKSIRVNIETSNDFYFAKNSNITLSCEPGLILNKLTENENLAEKSNKLRIKNLSQKDAGEYECLNETEQVKKFEITMIETPDIRNFETKSSIRSSFISRKPGSPLEQVCFASTNGIASPSGLVIEWLSPDGKIIQHNSKFEINNYVLSKSPLTKVSTLKIKFLDNKDFGNYECRISFGYLVDTLDFTINNPLNYSEKVQPIIKASQTLLNEGDNYEFNCEFEGQAYKQWLFNNQNVNKFSNLQVENGKLIIKEASLNLIGYITCRVTSEPIYAQNSIYIRVEKAIKTTTESSTTTTTTSTVEHKSSTEDIISEESISTEIEIQETSTQSNIDETEITTKESEVTELEDSLEVSTEKEINQEITRIGEFSTTTIEYKSSSEDLLSEISSTESETQESNIGETEITTKESKATEKEISEEATNPEEFSTTTVLEQEESTDISETTVSSQDETTESQETIEDVTTQLETVEETTETSSTTTSTIKLTSTEKLIETFIVAEDSVIEAEIGSNFVINCLTDNFYEDLKFFKFFWVIPFSNRKVKNVIKQNNLLEFRNFSEKNEGQYQCFFIENGELRNLTVTITAKAIEEIKSVKLEIEPRIVNATIGDQVIFKCVIKEGKELLNEAKMIWNNDKETSIDSELSIDIKSVNDSGTYSCQVVDSKNKIKSNLAIGLLNVFDPVATLKINITSTHQINYEKNTLLAKVGDNISLKCQVSTDAYDVSLEWEVDEKFDPNHHILSNQVGLEILNAQKNHSGSYRCIAQKSGSNLELSSKIIEIRVEFYEPIKIELKRREEDGMNILECTITQGFPVPEISWTRNNNSSFDMLELSFAESYSDLFLNHSNFDHYGLFKCIASNQFEVVSAEVKLEPIRTMYINSSSKYEFDEESNIDFICYSFDPNVQDEPVFEWKVKILNDLPDNISPKGNTLQIRNLDRSNEGTYQCKISSKDLSKSQTIIINLVVKRKLEAPTARITKKIINLEEGKRGSITCLATGYPTPDITWLFNDKNVKHYKNFYSYKHNLFIRDASLELNGYITCQARNNQSQIAEDTALLTVGGKKALFAEVSPAIKNVTLGTNVTFVCQLIDLDPIFTDVKFNWFKDKLLILENDSNGLLNINVNSLEDSGSYACQAYENKILIKSNFAKAELNVMEQLTLTIKSNVQIVDKQIVIKKSDSFSLDCVPSREEPVSIEWYNSNGLLVSRESKLTFTEVQLENSGLYLCKCITIEDTPLELSEQVNITVENYEPIAIELDYEEKEDEILLECIVTGGLPLPKLEWTRPNNLAINNESLFWHPFGSIFLVLSKNETSTNGIFQCVASNKYETKIDQLNLLIAKEPQGYTTYVTSVVTSTTTVQVPTTTTKEEATILSSSIESSTSSIITSPETTTVRISSTVISTQSLTNPTTTPETSTIITTTAIPITTTTTETSPITTTINTTTLSTTITTKIIYTTFTTKAKSSVKTIYANKTQDIILETGSDIDLVCTPFSKSQKNASISWMRKIEKYFPKNFLRKKETLKIRDFEQSNSGDYECSAVALDGTYETITITLKTKDKKLQAKLKKKYIELSSGSTALITCSTYPSYDNQIGQNRIKEVLWFINGRNSSEFKNLKAHRNELYILNASNDLHGVITCQALAKNGEKAEDTGVIKMNGRKILLVDIFPKLSNQTLGETVDLVCVIENSGQLSDLSTISFEWKKDDRIIKNKQNQVYSDSKLQIKVRSMKDAGSYSCQAYDINDNTKSNIASALLSVYINKDKISLNIESSKKIQDKQIIAKQSENITLHCMATSKEHQLIVDWFKTDDLLDPEYHIKSNDDFQLSIVNIQPEHSGRYSCLARTNDFNLDPVSDFVNITVERYEKMEIDIEQFEIENYIMLECSLLNGIPLPKLGWSKMDSADFEYEVKEYPHGISELYLNKENPNIYGTYECKATNKFETITKSFNLEKRLGDVEVKISEKIISLEIDLPYNIKCNLIGFSNSSRVEWFLNDTLLENSANIKIKRNVLQISKASREMNGLITCKVSEGLLSKNDSVELNIKEKSIELLVEIEPKHLKKSQSEIAIFKCLVKDLELIKDRITLIYYWFKEDGTMPEQVDNSFSNELVLENLTPKDSGIYSCEVKDIKNNKTSNLDSAHLSVIAKEVKEVYTGKILNQGDNVTLTCNLTLEIGSKIVWRKLYGDLEHGRHVSDGDKLHIINARPTDRGDYECSEENNQGNVQYIRIEVERREAPLISIYPSQEIIDRYGSYPSVQCQIIGGTPQPTLEWRREDGKPLSERVSVKNGILTIQNTQAEDVGVYQCVAKNLVGQVVKKIMINSAVKY